MRPGLVSANRLRYETSLECPWHLSRSREVRSIVLHMIPGQRARGGENISQVPLTRELPIYWVPVRVRTHAGPANRTACGVLGTLPRSKHRDPIPVHRCMISLRERDQRPRVALIIARGSTTGAPQRL